MYDIWNDNPKRDICRCHFCLNIYEQKELIKTDNFYICKSCNSKLQKIIEKLTIGFPEMVEQISIMIKKTKLKVINNGINQE